MPAPKMPTYVVISNHPPNSCPSSNRVLRARGEKLSSDVPALMKKHKVKPTIVLHLDPGHRVLWVLEAASAEAVRDMVYDGGFIQWNDFEFFMASTLEEITSRVSELPLVW